MNHIGNSGDTETMPSHVNNDVGFFDKLAEKSSLFIGRKYFFAFCILSILVWLPSRPLFQSSSDWQIPINTFTTILSYLMLAVLQNSTLRSDKAIQQKLNALAEGMADTMSAVSKIMDHLAMKSEADTFDNSILELRTAVGIEQKESS